MLIVSLLIQWWINKWWMEPGPASGSRSQNSTKNTVNQELLARVEQRRNRASLPGDGLPSHGPALFCTHTVLHSSWREPDGPRIWDGEEFVSGGPGATTAKNGDCGMRSTWGRTWCFQENLSLIPTSEHTKPHNFTGRLARPVISSRTWCSDGNVLYLYSPIW